MNTGFLFLSSTERAALPSANIRLTGKAANVKFGKKN